MSIIIKRKTGWTGMVSKIHIEVNGVKVDSVMEKKHIKIELPNGKARLKATQMGIKSNEIEVKDGDEVELTSTWITRFSFPLMMVTFIFTIFIPSLKYKIITLISVGALLMVLAFFVINGFHLKVLTEGINDENEY